MTHRKLNRPNVLFILADDLGQGDVSIFNPHAGWRTENLDRLAAEGMRFTDANATSALCTPSRYSALTGRYSWRSHLKRHVLPGDSMALIEKDRLTIPRFLKGNGYRTAIVGKWHLGLDWHLHERGNDFSAFGLQARPEPAEGERFGQDGNFDPAYQWEIEGIDIDYSKPVKYGPNQLGFDYSFITAASLDQPPYVYIENGVPMGIPAKYGGDQFQLDRRTPAHQRQIQKGPMVEGYDIHSVVGDFQAKALEVLDDLLSGEEPWFLYIPSHLVHGPIIPNEPWRGTSGHGPYGDFVLQLDSYVGELVSRIDESGKAEETIVIFTSDNGASGVAGLESLRERGHDPSNGWRGYKTDIWEGGHREPFIIRWPGKVEAGAATQHTISHSDLFRTLASILGSELPETAAEDSVNGLPLWMDSDKAIRKDLVSQSGGGGLALRAGDWKLVFITTGDGSDARISAEQGGVVTEYYPAQLFNLANDPGERQNILSQHPARVAEMTQTMVSYITAGRSTPGEPQANARNNPTGEWPQVEWVDQVQSEN